VPVLYRCYDSLAHGFTAFTGAIPAADGACREIAGLVRETFEKRDRLTFPVIPAKPGSAYPVGTQGPSAVRLPL
jgi:hypothetical protein